MIPLDVVVRRSARGGSFLAQGREILRLFDSPGRVLSLTFFVDAVDAAAYGVARNSLLAAVDELFGADAPAATVVAQPSHGGGRLVLEATVLAAPAGVGRRTCGGVAYTVVTDRGMRQIHCGGIGSTLSHDDPEAQATDAFAKMEGVLVAEGMTFGHVVRQWNYIEGLLELRADCPLGHQSYQVFNDVRAVAYARSTFPTGYPAATGIGQTAGGIVLEFIALDVPPDVRVEAISNPRQTDAHDYSGGMLVGESLVRLQNKCTPKFERAKLVARGDEQTVFVSGTAAIIGEQSVAPGDVEAQTHTTIDNISALVGGSRLSRLRAYVKHSRDIPAVRRICEATFGSIPAVYVQADICRDELLVELEGALRVPVREYA